MKIILYMFFLIIPIINFGQNNYYVATTGNNSNDGSFTHPWLTIQYGVNHLMPGDTLNIRAGTYFERVDIDVSGTENAYVTVRNYSGEEVILDASNFTDASAIIWTDNAYIRIVGLHLTNYFVNNSSGLAVQGRAHHIKILNNKISNINFSSNPNDPVNTNTNVVPLQILGDLFPDSVHSIEIRGNEVFNNRTGYSENITFGGNVSGFIVENNIVHNNTNIGIDVTGNYGECPVSLLDNARNGTIKNNTVYECNSPYSTSAGIYVDGGKNVVVENNVSYKNGYGGEIGCEENGETKNVVFRNNLFYENYYAGMHIGGYDENTTGIVKDSKILNNTFYHNDTGFQDNGELLLSESKDCVIENNIFYIASHNVYLSSSRTQDNLSLDYNLVYNDAGSENIITYGNYETVGLQNFYNVSGYGEHSTYGNPYFINAPSNFHIPKVSPAVSAGNPGFMADNDEVDLDNEPRVYGTVDCGADEHHPTYLLLQTKIFLEGAYNSGNGTMNASLGNNIPLTSPYTEDARTVSEIPSNVVDWVLLQLRETANGSAVFSKSVFLHKDGRIVADDGTTGEIELTAPEGNYYIVIKHRNHLAVMSANTVLLSLTNSTLYDFTTGSNKFYGNGGAKNLE